LSEPAATSAIQSYVFERVVCGVDRTDAGMAAARIAARAAAREGSLTIVAVDDTSIAVHAGWAMPNVLAELAATAEAALEEGRAAAEPLHEVDGKLVEGDPLTVIKHEIARVDATLVVVGSHGIRRATGIALGAVSTHLLHEAPCAVLVARGPVDAERWPRSVVVGIDGSEGSAHAHAAAHALATRYGAPLRVLVGLEDTHVDLEAAQRIAPELEEHEARALDLLNVASETADLVVVGSRGLRGIRALGSLSERLAHEARSPVLVVRTPGAPT
jgi:nucleotide-binding universal stress UspA family protein